MLGARCYHRSLSLSPSCAHPCLLNIEESRVSSLASRSTQSFGPGFLSHTLSLLRAREKHAPQFVRVNPCSFLPAFLLSPSPSLSCKTTRMGPVVVVVDVGGHAPRESDIFMPHDSESGRERERDRSRKDVGCARLVVASYHSRERKTRVKSDHTVQPCMSAATALP